MKELLYQKIYSHLREEIVSGRIPAGVRLPGVRELAEQWETSGNTVIKAVDLLQKDQLIDKRPGRGMIVCEPFEPQAAKTYTIGLIVQDIAAPCNAGLVSQIEKQAAASGMGLSIRSSSSGNETAIASEMENLGCSAVIIIPSAGISAAVFSGISIPVLFTGDFNPSAKFEGNFIVVDRYDAFYRMAVHMLESGCLNPAYIGASKELKLEPGYAACRDAVDGTRFGFREEYAVSAGGYETEQGKTAMQQLLLNEEYPDAVICATDTLAAGAFKACREAGLEVPGDIGITGAGNQDISEALDPSLTTIQSPDKLTALLCINAVSDIIKGSLVAESLIRVRLEMQLIFRDSSGTGESDGSEWL